MPAVCILVGMPGAGKSTVGRQLARRIGCGFVDSDHEIEREIGCSIASYFSQYGEQAFRELESRVLGALMASGQPVILSTGGGIVLSEANRGLLKTGGCVVYLRATAEDVFRRVRHDTARPLLKVDDPLKRLRELFDQRDPLYQDVAHFVVDSGRHSLNTTVNMVQMQLELSGHLG